MSDLIAYLLLLMGQPPQTPVSQTNEPQVTTQGGGIPIQPAQQVEPRP